MPIASPWMPHLSITIPAFFAQPDRGQIPPQAGFQLPAARTDFNNRPSPAPSQWPIAAAGLWLVVALGMLLRLALGFHLSARLVRASQPVEEGFRESGLVRVPITVGILRPVVILPKDWPDWAPDKLSAVLAHERSHVIRHDPMRQFGASIYRALAWFHPLAWWLHAELRRLAEETSDDAAIRAGRDRGQYAAALLSFMERTPHRVQWEGVSMANRQTRMRRIERVLDQNRNLSTPPNRRALAALILAAIPLGYLATATRPVRAQTRVAPSATPKPSPLSLNACGGNPAYAKWLDEDVGLHHHRRRACAFEQPSKLISEMQPVRRPVLASPRSDAWHRR